MTRLLASATAVVLGAALAATGAGALTVLDTGLLPAASAAAPPALATADVLPTPQIDGVAWKQVIVGNTVYVGGEFQNARPFGSAAGVNTVPRGNMLAYDLTSGVLDTTFAPTFNAKVDDMAVTPDHTKLIVVGLFTAVTMPGGAAQTRNHVAVFNLPTSGPATLSSTVKPSLDSEVSAVAATNSTIFLGGFFAKVDTTSRTRVASVSTTNGAVLPFSVHIDNNWVQSLAVSPDGKQVVIAGSFTSVSGSTNPGHGLYRANAITGAKMTLPVNAVVWAGDSNTAKTVSSGFMRLASDGTSFYGTIWDYSGAANSEGFFQAKWSDGSLVNLEDCHGDSYDVAPIGDIVYVSSHAHDCLDSGGFPETVPTRTVWSATAWTRTTAGTDTAPIYSGYSNHQGTARPGLLPFLPQFVPGTFTGKSQSTWTVTGNSSYVLYGGEFTKVDGISQQGLVRFGTRSVVTTPTVGPRTQSGGSFSPTVHSTASGTVHVAWPALWDRDGDTLTYQLYRNDSSTPVGPPITQTAFQWNGHSMSYDDTGQSPGASVRYAVRVSDSDGNVVNSDYTTTTVAGSDTMGSYGAQAVQDGASTYWRLDDAGSGVTDWSGADNPTTGPGVSGGATGAVTTTSGDTGASFNGSSTGEVIGQAPSLAPTTLSEEVWFKTTSTSGGMLAGYGSTSSGDSPSTDGLAKADRVISMDAAGHVLFGVMTSGTNTSGNKLVRSSATYNDDQWHQAVATLSSTGMTLYVDGAKVGSGSGATSANAIVYGGFWRLGGNNNSFGAKYFSGALDDFSVYPTALSASQVAGHYTTATGNPPDVPPTAHFTATTSAMTTSVDASTSRANDTNGSISSYAWDWGDGTNGTGETAHHTYARAGTYTVTLTVADDHGAADTATATVVARTTASPVYASDAFSRYASHGWGTAPVGGRWSIGGHAAQAGVSSGYGKLLVRSAATESALLSRVSTSRATTTMNFTLNKSFKGKKGQAITVGLVGRRVGTSQYAARVSVAQKGVTRIAILRNGTAITGAYHVPGLSIRPGKHYWLSIDVAGTSPTHIAARVWAVGGRVPSWQRSATDRTSALQHPGSIGLYVALPAKTKNAPVTLYVDSFSAR